MRNFFRLVVWWILLFVDSHVYSRENHGNHTIHHTSFVRFVEYLSLKEFIMYNVSKSFDFRSFSSEKNICGMETFNILFFGDSVNRYMVEDFCQKHNGSHATWGVGFSYNSGTSATYYCQLGHLTIGMINLYGSGPKGPYLHKYAKSKADPYADTELRIPEAIKQFSLTFGSPQLVLLRTDLWDMHLAMQHLIENPTQEKATIISVYLQHQIQNIQQIRQLLPTAFLGTHTVPEIDFRFGQEIFHQYMNANCFLSQQVSDFFVIDWRLALLGKNPNIYRRDVIHPNAVYSAAFLEFIVFLLESWFCSNRL